MSRRDSGPPSYGLWIACRRCLGSGVQTRRGRGAVLAESAVSVAVIVTYQLDRPTIVHKLWRYRISAPRRSHEPTGQWTGRHTGCG